MAMQPLAKMIVKRYHALKGARTNWDSHWDEIAEYIQPREDHVYENRRITGDKKRERLYDSTGEHSNELLASALHGNLTNPATIFFDLRTGDVELDQNEEVVEYLQTATRLMHDTLSNSNFHTEVHKMYLDLGSFGTANMLMEEDDTSIVRFTERPIFDAHICENSKGEVDTHFRIFDYDARQVMQEFSEEPTSQMDGELKEKLQKDIDNNKKRPHKIIHAVMPLKDLDDKKLKDSLQAKGFKWTSIYVHEKEGQILKASGFREFPYIVSRWSQASGEIYGRSPGMKALPDVKMINEMMKVTIRSAQKTVDPSVQMPSDGFLLPLNLTPGSINYHLPGTPDKIEPINIGGRVDFGLAMIDRVKQDITRAFFIDQLQLAEGGPQMTATEVQQRTEEKARLLGPILARQQWEFLKPLIKRLAGVLERRNLLPDPPDILAESEKPLEVQYSSLIARAQRTADSNNLNRALGSIQTVLAADPSALDNINPDKALRVAMRAFDVPVEILRKSEEVEELREARAEAAQQAAEQNQTNQDVDNASKLASVAG